jgi:hypothetical protein
MHFRIMKKHRIIMMTGKIHHHPKPNQIKESHPNIFFPPMTSADSDPA